MVLQSNRHQCKFKLSFAYKLSGYLFTHKKQIPLVMGLATFLIGGSNVACSGLSWHCHQQVSLDTVCQLKIKQWCCHLVATRGNVNIPKSKMLS